MAKSRHLGNPGQKAQKDFLALVALNETAQTVTSSLDLDKTLRSILHAAQGLTQSNLAEVWLRGGQQEGYVCKVARSATGTLHPQGAVIEKGKGLTGWVIEEGKALAIRETKNDPRWLANVMGSSWEVGSYLGIPIHSKGKVIGALVCFTEEPRDMPKGVVEAVSGLAAHAAIAIENARLYTEAQKRATTLEVLVEITKAIGSTLDLEELFKISLEQLKRVVPCHESTLYILGTDKKVISEFFLDSEDEDRKRWIESRRDLEGSQFEHVLQTKEPLYTSDTRESPYPRIQSLAALGLRSIIHTPILSEEECIGFLNVGSPEVNAFTEDHIDLLESVADHLAVAMKNAELYAVSQGRATNLEVMDEIAKAISSILDFDELFKITVEQVQRAIPCDRSSLYVLDADKKVVSDFYVVETGGEREQLIDNQPTIAGSHFEEALKTKNPVYTPDIRLSPHPRHQSLASLGLRSILNVPILSEEECVGFLNVGSKKVNAFTKEHIELLRSVADHLAVAMKNAELYAEVRETGERLDNFVRSASDGIATVDLEARITSWNPGMEAIYGYSEKEMHGQHILRIYPEGKGEFEELWNRLISGETLPPIETIRQRKDGNLVEISVMFSPVRDSKGEVVGISGINRDIGAKKRAEEKLRASEASLAQAQRISHLGSWDRDIAKNNVRWSDETYRIYGLTPKEYAPTHEAFLDLVHPEDREIVRESNKRTVREKQPYEMEFRIVRPDGEERIVYEQAEVMLDQSGNAIRMVGTVQDVTERVRTEEALRLTQFSVDRAADGIRRIAQDGQFLYVNDAVCRMLGYSREELVSMTISDINPDFGPEIWAEHWEKVKQAGSLTIETRNLTKDGRDVPIEVTDNYVDFGGKEYIIAFVRDITERKRAELERARFRTVMEQSAEAIYIADAGIGRLVDVNETACSMLGYTREELLQLHLSDVLVGYPLHSPGARSASVGRMKPEIAHVVSGEGVNRHKDGDMLPVEMSVSSRVFGGHLYHVVLARDVTERRRAEELARSNVELEQFAFVASHDLQEPLRTVSRYTKLLADRYKGKLDSDADDFLTFAADGAQRMQQLIRDMLAFSRVGTGGKSFEPTDCSAVCDEAIANLQVTIEESGAVVTRDSLPTVTGDGSQLVQLFQGLIGNAIKFRGEEPPRVHVSAKQNENEWIFCVHDNGIGIDSKNADRIFGIFQRLHTRAEYPGTGIGLSICKKIVERHGGRIWVESKPGKGSLLFFTLPKKKVSDLEF